MHIALLATQGFKGKGFGSLLFIHSALTMCWALYQTQNTQEPKNGHSGSDQRSIQSSIEPLTVTVVDALVEEYKNQGMWRGQLTAVVVISESALSVENGTVSNVRHSRDPKCFVCIVWERSPRSALVLRPKGALGRANVSRRDLTWKGKNQTKHIASNKAGLG